MKRKMPITLEKPPCPRVTPELKSLLDVLGGEGRTLKVSTCSLRFGGSTDDVLIKLVDLGMHYLRDYLQVTGGWDGYMLGESEFIVWDTLLTWFMLNPDRDGVSSEDASRSFGPGPVRDFIQRRCTDLGETDNGTYLLTREEAVVRHARALRHQHFVQVIIKHIDDVRQT